MSNTLAIAAVTSTMRHVLHEALSGDEPDPVGGADVTTYRPSQLSDADSVGTADSGLNVYLFQVTPNHAWNLSDLPTRRPDGSLAQRPLAALDLHYLVTAYGDEEGLEPQRLLARGALALASTPVFTKATIEDAVAKYAGRPELSFLTHADLPDQTELVKVSPTPLSLEEISKLWGVLGTSYLLSLAYTATVVLIEASVTPRRVLPVRERTLQVRPWTPPRLGAIAVTGGGPAVTGAEVVLTGSGLLSTSTVVSFSGVRVAPGAGSTTSRVACTLPPAVPAGVHAVQVVHLRAADPVSGAPERRLAGSNSLSLLLAPSVGAITTTATEVRVAIEPPVLEGQRAAVSFARLSGGAPGDPSTVGATYPPHEGAPSGRLVFPRADLPGGTWLVRAEVDGVESVPTMSADTYDQPAVTLP